MDSPKDIYHAFPASPDQDAAIMEVLTTTGLSWSELQEQMTQRRVIQSYGLSWPSVSRQESHGLKAERVPAQRGEAYTFGHVVTREQEAVLRKIASMHGEPRGWYTAFLELAFDEHFEEAYGVAWPPKRRLAQSAMERVPAHT